MFVVFIQENMLHRSSYDYHCNVYAPVGIKYGTYTNDMLLLIRPILLFASNFAHQPLKYIST